MSKHPQSKSGFTYIEVLMALTISSFILTASYATIISLAKGSESMINYAEMNKQSRIALEILGRDARMAYNVQTSTTTSIMLEREIQGTDYDVYYVFVPEAGTFSRTIYRDDNFNDPGKKTIASISNAEKTFLYDVDALKFTFYTLQHKKTTHSPEIKHVQIEGLLERRVLNVYNTNYIISARFMLRNKDVSS